MISTNDFKNGMTILYDNNIYLILEFMHVKPGKGGAFVRTKLKNLRTGTIIDYTFNAGEKVERAMIDKNKMQYIYDSGNFYVFMNNDTYEQVEVDKNLIRNEMNYITEGLEIELIQYNNEVLGVNLPDKVVLQIIECPPGVKGDTKTTATKDAVLETGLKVKVPLFVEEGEKIIVSTQTGEYVSREKN